MIFDGSSVSNEQGPSFKSSLFLTKSTHALSTLAHIHVLNSLCEVVGCDGLMEQHKNTNSLNRLLNLFFNFRSVRTTFH